MSKILTKVHEETFWIEGTYGQFCSLFHKNKYGKLRGKEFKVDKSPFLDTLDSDIPFGSKRSLYYYVKGEVEQKENGLEISLKSVKNNILAYLPLLFFFRIGDFSGSYDGSYGYF